jgi:hypothetical protein
LIWRERERERERENAKESYLSTAVVTHKFLGLATIAISSLWPCVAFLVGWLIGWLEVYYVGCWEM